MVKIIEEVLNYFPDKVVKDVFFEGAKIVVYTEDKDFFLNNKEVVKKAVDALKKRIEVRPDPSVLVPEEETEEKIREIIPEEAGIANILFDHYRSIVIIEAEKPGIVIGKSGENLAKIREQVHWVPIVKRLPPIRSKLIEEIRAVLYNNSEYRRKFLHKIGTRIYKGWTKERVNEWVRLTYLGSAREVGRSSILLQTKESKVLLDCGIKVGSRGQDAYPIFEAPEFDINDIDALIISHAHIDHTGLVPFLFKMGYNGPVYLTEPTRDIMALLQLDLIKIQRQNGENPLYGTEEIKKAVLHSVPLGYEEVTDITPDVRITFYNAGHILGSAMVHIHVGNGLHNILYSGDIKFSSSNLLSAATVNFPRLETLLLESTYGGKKNVFPKPKEQEEYLYNIVKETIERGGRVLMPVLGSGRGQEILLILVKLIEEGKLPKIPIYIEGMVWDITAIHTAYPEYLNPRVRKEIFHKDNNPFLSPYIKRIGSAKERAQVIEEAKPSVILATSGMLEGGPSVEYFKHLAENPKNSLVFSCYQAEGTLGRRLQQGEKEIAFKEGDTINIIPVRMQVNRVEISGHADRKELFNFVRKCNPRPRRILINHGELSRALDLARSLQQTFKIETYAPRNLDALRLI